MAGVGRLNLTEFRSASTASKKIQMQVRRGRPWLLRKGIQEVECADKASF